MPPFLIPENDINARCSPFGGIMMAWRITAGNPLYGADLTMSAISAVVVGAPASAAAAAASGAPLPA